MLVVLVTVRVQGINAAAALLVLSCCMNQGRVASLTPSMMTPGPKEAGEGVGFTTRRGPKIWADPVMLQV